ncbi:ABC transporter permease subunit [Oceanobacillus kimchii]|uniref:ABC transporter permease n=1 Tax=Oceanobacillus kimchii TaxID=746691 RepID=A0ABQ5TLB5_9BACI|nr:MULTISPECIES: ABC transporter permease subunit [Oceanobacillus]MBT2599408.1 ABC transporter permease subunit [Oceanobacillus sp. ISL-74]MCT1576596.1 ABC transporter permease subunit [Oceanobacillus kimchii]MCT2134666.1 ABC transporter permease subunit [Oceanobacillus kimchii]GLO67628.1 ABC transporter permease [Oceanobacillus kimchii]
MGIFPDIEFEAGKYVDQAVNFIDTTFEAFFDFIFFIASRSINLMTDGLMFLPWWLFIIIIFGLGWYFKSAFSGILYGAFIFIIGTFGLWEDMMITISIILTAVIICLIIGIPIGVAMSFSRLFSTIARPVLDAMQTMPSFVYLIPAIFFFGLGNVSAIFATLIYALPPVIRLTELAIRGVDKEIIESAHSFGSSKWQTLKKVQLPQATPTIMAGVNQTTMMALSMVVIASMVGASGLGEQVLVSINRIDIALGFEAGISIVFLAVIIDRITNGIAQKFQRQGDRA